MPFHIKPGKGDLTPEIRRLATGRIDHALTALDGYPDRPEALHDARKDVKKLRALLRLVGPALPGYKAEDTALRDAARQVSALRDDTAMLECLARIETRYGPALDAAQRAGLHAAFEAHRDAMAATDAGTRAVEALRTALSEMRARTEIWQIEGKGADAVAGGYRDTLSKARKAMRTARETGETTAFHDWRKHLKYHWYHAAMLKSVKPAKMKKRIALASDLGELLGDHHDLAALRTRLQTNPPKPPPSPELAATLDALAAAEMARIEAEVLARASNLFRRSPKAQAEQLKDWWRAAR